MPTFIMSLNWTDQGIRTIKDAAKRVQAGRDIAKKLGVDIKQVYLTTGDSDIVLLTEADDGNNIAKFAMALGALGNVHSRTIRAWPEAEYLKLVSELP
ncbi:GYD domain-containing protein [Microbacteriaceae bacterium K1510]|nr:GYD domain-containing protein [Microbacteriaceae bacterium K1510]